MAGRRLIYLSLETPREGQAALTHVQEIVRNLRDLDWDVRLIASRSGGASIDAGYLKKIAGYLGCYLRTAAALSSADVLFFRAHFAAWPIAMIARMMGKPVFHEINGKPVDFAITYPQLSSLAGVVGWLYRSQFARAAHLFPVTTGLKHWAIAFAGHERVTVVANAANTQLFSPHGPRGEIDGPYAVFVGGLVAWHGLDTMLAALDHPDWPSSVRLVIAGDGIERQKLLALRDHPRLVWLGRVPQSEVPPLLRGALVALCVISDPAGRSSSGVAPLKLFEAMATGTAVIVSDLPFQADIVRERNAGLVVPPNDPAGLARAVAAFARSNEDAVAMGRNGADYAAKHASWRQRAEDISTIMEQSIGAN